MLGLTNNDGYCFVNSVIHMLYSLEDFSKNIIDFHENDCIVDGGGTEIDKLFVNDFCQLMFALYTTDEVLLNKVIAKFQNYFRSDIYGDDVFKCCMTILTNLHKVIDKNMNNGNVDFTTDISTNERGFVNKLFQGSMLIVDQCKECHLIIKENHQFFRSIPLPVDTSGKATLSSCLEIFLSDTEIISDCDPKQCCAKPTIKSKMVITETPKYLILYLSRGSFLVGGEKKSSFVDSDCIIMVPTKSGDVCYAVVAVIDHFGDSTGGHFVTKGLRGCDWWIFNDQQVKEYKTEAIITHNSIMFALQKIE